MALDGWLSNFMNQQPADKTFPKRVAFSVPITKAVPRKIAITQLKNKSKGRSNNGN